MHNLDGICVSLVPAKANPVLVIDPDAVVSGAGATQRFQVVARRNSQIVQGHRSV